MTTQRLKEILANPKAEDVPVLVDEIRKLQALCRSQGRKLIVAADC